MTVGDLNTLEGERHGDRRAHRQPPRPADAHERRGDARALPQPQLADGPRLRRLRHGLPARLDQRERQAAGRGLRLQQRPRRKRALVRRRRRLRRDRAAARRLPAAHAGRFQQLDDARADEGGGHERREQRRRMGAARAPRRLQRPERSAAPGRRAVQPAVRDHALALHPVPRLAQGRGRRGPRAGQDRARGRRRAAQAEGRRRPRPRAHGQPPRQPVLRAGRDERPALELLGATSTTARITRPRSRPRATPTRARRPSRSACRAPTTAGPRT